MGSDDRDQCERLRQLLDTLAKDGALDEEIAEVLAAFEREQTRECLAPALEARVVAAAKRGSFDGRVTRARKRMHGALGGFGPALGRIRDAARLTIEEMAERAGISNEEWEAIESQQRRPESLSTWVLTSVVETAQLGIRELAEILRRTEQLRLVPRGPSSFRSDGESGADRAAAHDDLLSALDDSEQTTEVPEASEQAHRIVREVSEELQRRGRDDLL